MSRPDSWRRPGRVRPPSWNSGLARPEGVPLELLWDTGTVWGWPGHPPSSAPSRGDRNYPLWERRAALVLRSTTPLASPTPATASTASAAASATLPLPVGTEPGVRGGSGTSQPVPAPPSSLLGTRLGIGVRTCGYPRDLLLAVGRCPAGVAVTFPPVVAHLAGGDSVRAVAAPPGPAAAPGGAIPPPTPWLLHLAEQFLSP